MGTSVDTSVESVKNNVETRKSILLLMNGFGIEVPKSFNVYKAALMPSLAKLSNHYPFGTVFASGTEIGLNKGQLSSFAEGYAAFSSMGQANKKYYVVEKSMEENTFETNPVIMNSIKYAIMNNSRIHILFSIGERTEETQFEQLKRYALLCAQSGIKDICVHIFLGDNSVKGLKVSANWLNVLRYHVMADVPGMRLVSIAGRKYLTDASTDEKKAYYRMIVSGVGEIWSNYEDTLIKKYEAKYDDDNMGGFLTVRENVLHSNDSIMNFNYDNVGAEYLTIIQNPTAYFPAGKLPFNVAINSLFEVKGNPNIPYAYKGGLPETYFFENIPDDKKVLIIADQDRIQYISKCLNGFREKFKPNISVWPIENKRQRFELMAQYLNAYINKDVYDLIIADCDLFNDQVDTQTIEQLRYNMSAIDKVLNVAYTRGMEKNYTLYVTSFYGIKKTLSLTATSENIDFSQRTPLMVAGNDIARNNIAIQIDGNFTQLAQVLQANMGADVKPTLITFKSFGKKQKKMYMIIGGIIIVFLIFLLYAFLYIQGYI